MKQFIYILCVAVVSILSSCNNSNQDEIKQYIIVRYDDTYKTASINDGSAHWTRDEKKIKSSNGDDALFNSVASVINYMILHDWKFEGVITQHPSTLATDDASMLFSKSSSKEELKKLEQSFYFIDED